jgi:cell wall-associated NlpC family hydrolase
MSNPLPQRAERALRALRRELEAEYGWTLLAVELTADPERRALCARGTVVAPRATRSLAAALTDVLPEGFRLDVTGLRPLRTGEWRELGRSRASLWQKLPRAARVLATELEPSDGPVELLATVGEAALVRGMDATVGWLDAPPGASVSPPSIEPAHGTVDAVVAAARAFLGAPYRLGGASESGVDCSALVARAFRRGMGVIVPRHSTDQLQATLHVHSAPRRDGDLVFTWTEREGPCHVGVLAAGDVATVVHASQSRQHVVEDPLERFLKDATRMEFVPFPSVLGYHARNVGNTSLELPLEDEEPA